MAEALRVGLIGGGLLVALLIQQGLFALAGWVEGPSETRLIAALIITVVGIVYSLALIVALVWFLVELTINFSAGA